jgi:hypothetical protein
MGLTKSSSFHRRALLGAGLVLSLGSCVQVGDLFGQHRTYTLTPRGDRLVRWLQHEGKDAVMAPEAFALMGLDRGGRDIPVKQLAEEGKDGRYVISLVNFRNVHELVLHRKQGDVLVFHHCDTKFTRFSSVRYPRNGKPAVITDAALADSDFQQQLAFWFDRMPGR